MQRFPWARRTLAFKCKGRREFGTQGAGTNVSIKWSINSDQMPAFRGPLLLTKIRVNLTQKLYYLLYSFFLANIDLIKHWNAITDTAELQEEDIKHNSSISR